MLQADRNLVRTIPGVGPQAADHLLVLLRTRPLNSAREAAALAGVIPVHKQSGTSVCGRPKMSGQGDRRVRSGLYMPVLSACTHDPGFKARYQALIASGKPKKSALIACMHRLVRVAYGVLRHQQPYHADHSRSGLQAT
jgi:transposase